jgi:hypothetical protein
VQVKTLLASATNAGAVVTALPDLLDPACLVRTLVYVASALGGKDQPVDPVAFLQSNPEAVKSMMGDSEMEDSAEYGGLGTAS